MTWTTWSSVGTSSSWLKSRILSILGRLFEIVSRGGVKGTVRLGQTRRFRWRTFPDDPDVFFLYLQQRYSCFKSTKSGKPPRHPERRSLRQLEHCQYGQNAGCCSPPSSVLRQSRCGSYVDSSLACWAAPASACNCWSGRERLAVAAADGRESLEEESTPERILRKLW